MATPKLRNKNSKLPGVGGIPHPRLLLKQGLLGHILAQGDNSQLTHALGDRALPDEASSGVADLPTKTLNPKP